MEETSLVRNGVDIKKLIGTIKAVGTDPALGKFQFRVSNQWVNGGFNKSYIKDFYGAGQADNTRNAPFTCANDEPGVLLGQNKAPNPAEFVLHALAGCLTTSMVYHAAARGYKIRRINSTLEGDLDIRGFLDIDGAERNGYKAIRINFDIDGDFSAEVKEAILNMGPSLSPVFDIVRNGVPISVSLSNTAKEVEIDC